MSWVDGVDQPTGTLISAAIWNNYMGTSGSLMVVKTHAHGGATGEGSQSLGPVVLEDFTDAAAPAAPGASKTRVYSVSGRVRYRAGAAGADTGIADGQHVHTGATADGNPIDEQRGLSAGTGPHILGVG